MVMVMVSWEGEGEWSGERRGREGEFEIKRCTYTSNPI